MQGLRTCAAVFGYPRVPDSRRNERPSISAAIKLGLKAGISGTRITVLIMALFAALILSGRSSAQAFSDNFNLGKLDSAKWTVATYGSPDSAAGINSGIYAAPKLNFARGMLRIEVTQDKQGAEVHSLGGAIISKRLFGFGTYEFVMRMSSTASRPYAAGGTVTGAVSSGFLYLKNSQTEIDLEFLGNENSIWITSWNNPDPTRPPTATDKTTDKVSNHFLATQFRTYKLVWSAKAVNVYIDGTQVVHQTTHVPQAPAHIILQHRGTNSDKWGGVATPGLPRFFYVKSVSFTPEGR